MSGATPLIAVVDDEESVRRALERLIRSARFDAESHAGGDEFLRTLADHRPDCIVLDVHMPNLDGFQVQSRLAEAHVSIPVIVITGHDTAETHTRALKGGAVAYLRKPVDAEALLSAIASAVRKKEDLSN